MPLVNCLDHSLTLQHQVLGLHHLQINMVRVLADDTRQGWGRGTFQVMVPMYIYDRVCVSRNENIVQFLLTSLVI
jgi:hypothetical protein